VVSKYRAPSAPEGALAVANCPNLKTPSIIKFPLFVCGSGPSFIGAGRLELKSLDQKDVYY